MLGVGLVILAAIPFVAKNFYIFQITLAIIYAIAILGLNLLTGFNGQFSLGHSAFYAIGAYTAAIMMENLGVSYVWTHSGRGDRLLRVRLPVRPAGAAAGKHLPGARDVRARDRDPAGAQILAWSSTGPAACRASSSSSRTRRSACRSTPTSGSMSSRVAVAIVMYVCAANLVNSRTGRALIAIRDHPIAASAMGINVSLYKSLTFGVSALYTGVAGALGAIAIAFVAPDSFTFVLAVTLFVGLVVGGVGSIPGTIVGGFFMLFVPNIAESGLEGPGRRGLRGDPDAGHLS